MRSVRIAFLVALFLPQSAIAWLCAAQTNEETQGQAAEQAGKLREAVTHYVAAFRSTPWSASEAKNRLEAKIIELVLKLDPPPAIPEEAERRMTRGKAALKSAQNPSDYEAASSEFLEAMNQAPWWADVYFNLGLVREKQKEYARAISNLKNYLSAAPSASDAKEVKAKIYELEYLLEKETKAKAEEEQRERRRIEQVENARRREEARIQSLAGEWTGKLLYYAPQTFRIVVSGKRVQIWQTEWVRHNTKRNVWEMDAVNFLCIDGRIEGNNRLVGTLYFAYTGRDPFPPGELQRLQNNRPAESVDRTYSITWDDEDTIVITEEIRGGYEVPSKDRSSYRWTRR